MSRSRDQEDERLAEYQGLDPNTMKPKSRELLDHEARDAESMNRLELESGLEMAVEDAMLHFMEPNRKTVRKLDVIAVTVLAERGYDQAHVGLGELLEYLGRQGHHLNDHFDAVRRLHRLGMPIAGANLQRILRRER